MAAEPSANPVAALDEYELRHLPEHLVDAGRAGDLHKLLRLEWIEDLRRNANCGNDGAATEPVEPTAAEVG